MPEYRVKIYCLFGLLFCVGGACFSAQELFEALETLQLEVSHPRRNHTVELLVYDREPYWFLFHFIKQAAFSIAFMILGLCMGWRMVRGRKAFKKIGKRLGILSN